MCIRDRDKDQITLADISAMFGAAVEGIMERGKASPGDCTMLDALIPAQEAVDNYAAKGLSISKAIAAAVKAAVSGAQATAAMTAKHGRAGWLNEKSVGVPDAGATAIAMMLQSLARHLA